MKYLVKFIIVLSFLAPASGYSQGKEEKPKYAPGREKHRNKTDEIGRKQGTWIFYNTFGEKLSEIDFVNDQKEGIERKFYGYNKVREETEFLAAVKDGQYTRYYFSGQVAQEGFYHEGKKDGKWTRYFEDGSIRQEGGYKMNKRDGVWKTYNRKGVVVGQTSYVNGVDSSVIEAAQKKKDEEKKEAEKKAAGAKKKPIPVKKDSKPSDKDPGVKK